MKSLAMFLILITSHNSCSDRTGRSSVNGSPSSYDRTEVLRLIYDLGNKDENIRKERAAQLMATANRTENDRLVVTSSLIEESKRICSVKRDGRPPIIPFDEFYKLRALADILANLHELDALDVLIDCSDVSSAVLGWSNSHLATMDAVLKYKGDALPALKRKMSSANNEVKCNIANALATLGGKKEKAFLMSTKTRETDKVLVSCLESCASFIDRK